MFLKTSDQYISETSPFFLLELNFTMNEDMPKLKALMEKPQTVKCHPYNYTTPELQHSVNHG